MKVWVGKEFPSTTNVEYTGVSQLCHYTIILISQGALLGTFSGPGTQGQVLEITAKTEVEGTHVVVQMKTDIINLMEIEVFGEPLSDRGM